MIIADAILDVAVDVAVVDFARVQGRPIGESLVPQASHDGQAFVCQVRRPVDCTRTGALGSSYFGQTIDFWIDVPGNACNFPGQEPATAILRGLPQKKSPIAGLDHAEIDYSLVVGLRWIASALSPP